MLQCAIFKTIGFFLKLKLTLVRACYKKSRSFGVVDVLCSSCAQIKEETLIFGRLVELEPVGVISRQLNKVCVLAFESMDFSSRKSGKLQFC